MFLFLVFKKNYTRSTIIFTVLISDLKSIKFSITLHKQSVY